MRRGRGHAVGTRRYWRRANTGRAFWSWEPRRGSLRGRCREPWRRCFRRCGFGCFVLSLFLHIDVFRLVRGDMLGLVYSEMLRLAYVDMLRLAYVDALGLAHVDTVGLVNFDMLRARLGDLDPLRSINLNGLGLGLGLGLVDLHPLGFANRCCLGLRRLFDMAWFWRRGWRRRFGRMRRVDKLVLRLVGIWFWRFALCGSGRGLFACIHGLPKSEDILGHLWALLRALFGDFWTLLGNIRGLLGCLWALLSLAFCHLFHNAVSRRCRGDRIRLAFRLALRCWFWLWFWYERLLSRDLGLDFGHCLWLMRGLEWMFWATRRHGLLWEFRDIWLRG